MCGKKKIGTLREWGWRVTGKAYMSLSAVKLMYCIFIVVPGSSEKRFVHFTYINLTQKKNYVSRYGILINDMHAGVF